jgi:hypothetical protein
VCPAIFFFFCSKRDQLFCVCARSSPIETCDGIAANHGAVQFQTACDSDKGSQPRGDLVPIVPACESDTFTGWRLFDAGRRSLGIARSSSLTRTTDRSRRQRGARNGAGVGHWGHENDLVLLSLARARGGTERGTVPAGHLDRSKGNPKGPPKVGSPGGGKTAIARRKEEDRKQIRRPASQRAKTYISSLVLVVLVIRSSSLCSILSSFFAHPPSLGASL